MARIKIPGGPIAPNFRRRINLTPDEALDVGDDGNYAAIEPVEGDSTVTLRTDASGNQESTSKSIKVFVNGDGTLGTGKVSRVVADGHVGPEKVTISIELEHDVAHKDATEFNSTVEVEGKDEPIPATEPA